MDVKGHYIFLTPTIGGVGGSQLYVAAKVAWLEKSGWSVDVFYIDGQAVRISQLERFIPNRVLEFNYRFTIYSDSERKKIADKILSGHDEERIIIESYSFETGLWGEYIARQCRGKHICYLITEQYPGLTKSIKKFLRFKLSQHLLYGITAKNIPSILPEADGASTYLRAEGGSHFNAIDIDDERIKTIPEGGFKILTVGRLDKPYVQELFREVAKFSKEADEIIHFIVVGDTDNNKIREELDAIVGNSDNLKVYYWGYTFPIPKQLFNIADVFAGCSGSAYAAYKERVPVISIDTNDCKGIGIVGETTENRVYRNLSEPAIPVGDLLQIIYSERRERRLKRQGLLPIVELPDFSRHAEIMEVSFDNNYYPVEKVRNAFIFDLVYNGIAFVGGRKLLSAVKHIKQKIRPSK